MATPVSGSVSLRPVWNLPTYLTLFRFVLAPVVFWLVLTRSDPAGQLLAATLFAVAVGSDFLDGHLARRNSQITPFGKLMDPIADKLLVVGTLVCLSVIGLVPWWATAIIAAREGAVTMMRRSLVRDGYPVHAAGFGGKLKMVVQSLALLLYLLPLEAKAGAPAISDLRLLTLVVAVVLTVWTGLSYLKEIALHRVSWPSP